MTGCDPGRSITGAPYNGVIIGCVVPLVERTASSFARGTNALALVLSDLLVSARGEESVGFLKAGMMNGAAERLSFPGERGDGAFRLWELAILLLLPSVECECSLGSSLCGEKSIGLIGGT